MLHCQITSSSSVASVFVAISVTSILNLKKRKIRVKKQLHKCKEKRFCAKKTFKKRKIPKRKKIVYCIFVNKLFKKYYVFSKKKLKRVGLNKLCQWGSQARRACLYSAKSLKVLKVAKMSYNLTPSKKKM